MSASLTKGAIMEDELLKLKAMKIIQLAYEHPKDIKDRMGITTFLYCTPMFRK